MIISITIVVALIFALHMFGDRLVTQGIENFRKDTEFIKEVCKPLFNGDNHRIKKSGRYLQWENVKIDCWPGTACEPGWHYDTYVCEKYYEDIYQPVLRCHSRSKELGRIYNRMNDLHQKQESKKQDWKEKELNRIKEKYGR